MWFCTWLLAPASLGSNEASWFKLNKCLCSKFPWPGEEDPFPTQITWAMTTIAMALFATSPGPNSQWPRLHQRFESLARREGERLWDHTLHQQLPTKIKQQRWYIQLSAISKTVLCCAVPTWTAYNESCVWFRQKPGVPNLPCEGWHWVTALASLNSLFFLIKIGSRFKKGCRLKKYSKDDIYVNRANVCHDNPVNTVKVESNTEAFYPERRRQAFIWLTAVIQQTSLDEMNEWMNEC